MQNDKTYPSDRLALIYKYADFNYQVQYDININLPFSFAKWHNSEPTMTGMRLDTSAYTRNFSINLTYRFGGYTTKERKSVDTSCFGR